MTEIVKPNFPAQEGYEYLASVGLTEEVLKNCCVKEAEVVAVNSRQTVTVECDGVEYADVPVWIHTDIGARTALMKGVEVTPEDYFKDAALIFPFKKYSGSYGSTILFEPLVFVIQHNNPATEEKTVLGIIGVQQNINSSAISLQQTYRPYLTFILSAKKWQATTTTYYHTLIDMMTGGIAVIPSYTDGVPHSPMLPVDMETTSSRYSNFLSGGAVISSAHTIPAPVLRGDPGCFTFNIGGGGSFLTSFQLDVPVQACVYLDGTDGYGFSTTEERTLYAGGWESDCFESTVGFISTMSGNGADGYHKRTFHINSMKAVSPASGRRTAPDLLGLIGLASGDLSNPLLIESPIYNFVSHSTMGTEIQCSININRDLFYEHEVTQTNYELTSYSATRDVTETISLAHGDSSIEKEYVISTIDQENPGAINAGTPNYVANYCSASYKSIYISPVCFGLGGDITVYLPNMNIVRRNAGGTIQTVEPLHQEPVVLETFHANSIEYPLNLQAHIQRSLETIWSEIGDEIYDIRLYGIAIQMVPYDPRIAMLELETEP